MRVAVTGASGFVGGAVCRAAVDAGWTVTAFGRRPSVKPAHVGGAPYVSWDLLRGAPETPAVDAVIHCAGSVTDWGPAREIWSANVDGTRAAAATFPGARFVHVSTASVYDPYKPTVMALENQAPVKRYQNAYGASKAAAERLVIKAMQSRPAIILRPHAVYGPGDPTLLPRILATIKGPFLPAPGSGTQRVSLTSIENLTQACLLAALGPTATGIYNVTDPTPVVIDQAFRALLKERGIRAHPIYLPQKPLNPLAALIEAAHLITGSSTPPNLTRYALSHLAVERTLNIQAARTHLEYTPTETTFKSAATW